ncbi:hypothetical protein SAMN06265222_10962 [Neorhodopirellula lusitana]|uniref:Uncharacterized protein n=1 Tax=Neorhodopirellula lusitana TaxID=445327 RepID=A0ABY1QAT4_9BACT|nr:hypothetical protein [Neorhodopirellula lusitana]SMP65487.1 hypothetical protein SAMN06265222_10962 [Neorhodopirellula lusitana]
MSEADVRNIESLEDLERAINHLSERLGLQSYQLQSVVTRAQRHFGQDYPAYWRGQLRSAEQSFAEARDRLSRKKFAVRAGETHPATEEKKQVNRWKNRIRLCQQRIEKSRSIAIEMEQSCEKFKVPIAALTELAEVDLPTASTQLAGLVARLRAYQDGSSQSS